MESPAGEAIMVILIALSVAIFVGFRIYLVFRR